jgi:hypothetical protein
MPRTEKSRPSSGACGKEIKRHTKEAAKIISAATMMTNTALKSLALLI